MPKISTTEMVVIKLGGIEIALGIFQDVDMKPILIGIVQTRQWKLVEQESPRL